MFRQMGIRYGAMLSAAILLVACGDSSPPGGNPPPADTGVLEDTGKPKDSGTPDTGTPDTGTPDTGTPDTGTPDTGTPDAGPASRAPARFMGSHHELSWCGASNDLESIRGVYRHCRRSVLARDDDRP